VIIADTSGLLAYLNQTDHDHQRIVRFVDDLPDAVVVSPYVVAELDYMVATQVGTVQEVAMLAQLSSGAYELPAIDRADLAACAEVVAKYRDQDIGVTDASLVVLARRYDTRRILTLDHRHFEVVRPLQGGRFRIVP
jgi:uncharacterized protein